MPADPSMPLYTTRITGRRWLTAKVFELRFDRPAGFQYRPGQKFGFTGIGEGREYTLLGPADADELSICVRHIPQGRFTPRLAEAPIGAVFEITAPGGYFTFKPSPRPPVLIATGTGIAPFVAFSRAGVRHFDLLHGVRSETDLYYREELAAAARKYIPCLSERAGRDGSPAFFPGRVDACLSERYEPGIYDFYLCGRTDMIRDVTHLIDRRFAGSFIYTEAFF